MAKPENNIRLGEICTIVDCEHKTAPLEIEGTPSIRTPNIGKGRLILDPVNRVSERTYQLWTRRAIPKAGDLIMAREAPVGNVAIIPKDLKVCLGQRTVLIQRKSKEIDSNFLNYLLNSQALNALLLSLSNGATVGHLNVTEIRKLPLPKLPPLKVQKKIAAVLAAYDDLIENNNRRIALLEKMAEELYREWFVRMRFPGHASTKKDPKTSLPLGWENKKCIDAMDVLSGGTPKTDVPAYWDGDIAFFTPTDAIDTVYAFETEKRITEQGLQKCNSKLYPKDTVFITARGTVGNLNLAGKDMAMNQSCYALKGKKGIGQLYLYYAVNSIISVFKQVSIGGVFDTITVKTFHYLPFLIASPEMIQNFESKVRPILEQTTLLSQRNSNLKRSRDMLLSRLISGKLSVEHLDIQFPPSMEEEHPPLAEKKCA